VSPLSESIKCFQITILVNQTKFSFIQSNFHRTLSTNYLLLIIFLKDSFSRIEKLEEKMVILIESITYKVCIQLVRFKNRSELWLSCIVFMILQIAKAKKRVLSAMDELISITMVRQCFELQMCEYLLWEIVGASLFLTRACKLVV